MIGNPLLLSDEGYQISRSVRLRSSASAYFNRTPGSAGNRSTWTWSAWVKRGTLGSIQALLSAGTSGSSTNLVALQFTSSDTLQFYLDTGTASYTLITTQVFRDPSAWYHIVVVLDTPQATAANRMLMYVNGVQVTAFSTASYTVQNNTYGVNAALAHNLGRYVFDGTRYFDGYLTEINLIDGQALTPSSFGETDAATGVWKPKKYAGTYGTNGFYLNFSDNSSNTATTIGKDYSGNGNNWTPNNISVTAGVTYDSMLDVPTMWADGGNGRGNYAVLNPLSNGLGNAPSNANLRLSGVSGVTTRINSTIGVSSGKWYFEATLTTASDYNSIGIGQNNITNQYPGNDALSYAQTLERATSINNNVQPSYGTAFSSGDVFICAFDLDNNKLFFGRNGTWFGSSDPAAGTNPVYTLTAGTYNAIARPNPSGFGSGGVLDINFGQRPFSYTPPTGFKALNTLNLPDPTIMNGASYMAATTYTGTGSALSITNSGSMQPDLVWIKSRSSVENNFLFDSVRGSAPNYSRLSSNLADAEATPGIAMLTAINSNGFTLGTNGGVNTNAATFVAWQWKEGATQGFDIVTYTGTGANRTIAHSLGVAPAMMIVKNRATTDGWPVYHKNSGASPQNGGLGLNLTNSFITDATWWNNTNPTSSVFSLGSSSGTNGNGNAMVMYLFSEVAGFSKFGSYTGNGSSDGPFVFCGFRPRWVMVKKTSATDDWVVFDTARDTFNVVNDWLFPNLSNAELTTAGSPDVLSNGFKLRSNSGATNASGASFIFAAFAESPFKTALAR